MTHPWQTIYGQPPSKSNSYRIVTIKGHGSLAKTKAITEYEKGFFMQCSLRRLNIATKFKLVLFVYFASDRPDLDNAIKVIMDCMQSCGVIENDRLCVEIHARKFIDKSNPRIEFYIEELL